MRSDRFVTAGPALVVLLVAAIAVLAAPSAVRHVRLAQTRATVELAQQRLDSDDVLQRLSRATADLSDAVGPSVVHVEASGAVVEGVPSSEGAGWAFDSRGHIVTNAHVVREATAITVQFSDGRAVPARFVGEDRSTDIAVIKVDADPAVIAARRAVPDSLRRGDRVYAFGSPFGFKFSMTEGIVSGLGRAADGPTGRGGYSNFIQTDAAANPGNSGGPLVDSTGRVVGMITAIVTANNTRAFHDRQGQNAGVGFAIPIETIEAVVSQVIAKGIVLRGYLGIGLADAADIKSLVPRRTAPTAGSGATGEEGVPEQVDEETTPLPRRVASLGSGVYITGVVAEQPADRAGLRTGDVITHLDGVRMHSSDVLRSKISARKPGETVRLSVVREGATLEFRVPLGAAAVNAAGALEPVEDDTDRHGEL